jgi:peptidoglycan lytic transglycosylase G
LSQHGVIGSSLAFRISDFFHGSPTVLPGIYALHKNQTFAEVRALLAAGPNVTAVDVVPGYTLAEVAQKVGDAPGHTPASFEKVAASGAVHSAFSPAGSNDLEGMLGTGEYLVLPGESDLTVLEDMVQRFDRDAEAAGLSTASASALGLTPYQVITAASVVEKEGYYSFNMPKVARVIYNRLAQDLPLQMDSTVLYAIGQDGGPVTPQDLKIVSPYNTYLNQGLPPTPICMPSTAALSAALHPPPGAWLYFTLVQKNGVMAFSDTYAEQLANEQLAKSRGLP